MPTMTLQKIKDIDQKIAKLKYVQEKLQQHLELKIISLLKTEKAFAVDFEILYGAIYELTQKLKNDNFNNIDSNHLHTHEMANWRQLGISLLQKGKEKEKNTNAKTKSSKSISEKIAVTNNVS
ncbi:MAG: hypothetical protein QG556_133 [Pseudomonadota bacterium]|nr:hypothetical protein [Pseudomonadota bacterium]